MHRLNARFPRRVLLWPVSVQGERAAQEVAAAIRGFNALGPGGVLPRPDLIIVARGGGSIEDLMAFNEETVVRAAVDSAIPLISAVGHETDTTLLDFAADIRAPTPTAAAELAVPVRADLLTQTLDFQRRMQRCFAKGMEDRRRHLAQLARILPRPELLFAGQRQRLDFAGARLDPGLRRNLQEHRRALAEAGAVLRPARIARQIALGAERARALVAAPRPRPAQRAGRAAQASGGAGPRPRRHLLPLGAGARLRAGAGRGRHDPPPRRRRRARRASDPLLRGRRKRRDGRRHRHAEAKIETQDCGQAGKFVLTPDLAKVSA